MWKSRFWIELHNRNRLRSSLWRAKTRLDTERSTLWPSWATNNGQSKIFLSSIESPGTETKIQDLKAILDEGKTMNLIDVRPSIEYGICRLEPSKSKCRYHINDILLIWSCLDVPLHELVAKPEAYLPDDENIPTYVVCRLGNDSQIAADALHYYRPAGEVRDVIGGLREWSTKIDTNFPIY